MFGKVLILNCSPFTPFWQYIGVTKSGLSCCWDCNSGCGTSCRRFRKKRGAVDTPALKRANYAIVDSENRYRCYLCCVDDMTIRTCCSRKHVTVEFVGKDKALFTFKDEDEVSAWRRLMVEQEGERLS